MSVLEEVKQMKDQGMTDDQIVQLMRDKGAPYRDIADALAQTQIKAAVEQKDEPQIPYQQDQPQEPMLQPSLLQSPQAPDGGSQAPIQAQYQPQEAPSQQQYYPQSQDQQYGTQQQDYAQPGDQYYGYPQSSDMISEIAEQVVADKMSELRKHIEKVIDFRTTAESKIQFIDERLKRIEKVIDTLQSSVLRKVGDYVTNVEDIKRELVETQKTFSKIVPGRHHTQSSHTTHHTTHQKHHKK